MTRKKIIESNTRPSIHNFKMTYWVKHLVVDYNGCPDFLSIKLHNNGETQCAIATIDLELTSLGVTYHFDSDRNRYTFRHHIHKVLDSLIGLKYCISYQTYYQAKVLFLYDGPSISIVAKNP